VQAHTLALEVEGLDPVTGDKGPNQARAKIPSPVCASGSASAPVKASRAVNATCHNTWISANSPHNQALKKYTGANQ